MFTYHCPSSLLKRGRNRPVDKKMREYVNGNVRLLHQATCNQYKRAYNLWFSFYRSELLAAPQLVVMTAWCEIDEEWALRRGAIRYNGAKKLSSLERTRYGAQRSQARGYRETESFFDTF